MNSPIMRNLVIFNRIRWTFGVRHASSVAEAAPDVSQKRNHDRMRGWQIHNYSESVEELQSSTNMKKPHIKSPSQLLVKIAASSVNPLDVAMISKNELYERISNFKLYSSQMGTGQRY